MGEALPKQGDLIGVRYRIEKELGRGGMGAVYAAVNQATGRAVAIKWLLPAAARSSESLARFLAEARATAKIEHPNVIQILDVGQDGGAPFLVMERLRGQSLAERLEKGPLSVHETLEVMLPSCRGIHEAHQEGIIHRDLKPDNLFLCQGKDGSKRPPKVLDFGISKLYDEETPGAGSPMTRTGIAMGTPWYMSPEQINAVPDPDVRFDVYAMGVVLYECLTGRPPYNAEGLFELVQQIAAGNPTPIRAMVPGCPPDLEAVTMRAMAAHRDHRYSSMRELIAELETIEHRIRSGAPPPAGAAVPMTGGQPYQAPATGPMGGGYTPAAYTPAPGYPPATGPNYPTGPGMHPPSGAMTGQVAQSSGGGGKGLVIGLVLGLGAIFLLGLIGVAGAIFAFSGDEDEPGGISSGGGVLGGLGDIAPSTNPREPQIDLTFGGDCHPRFDARRMVTGGGGNVNVISTSAGGITGSVIMSFQTLSGTVPLSTQQRMDDQTAINVMVGQSLWTNMTTDIMAVRSGRIPDPISGSVVVHSFDSELATIDVEFHDVHLQNMQTGTICTVDGRVRTSGTTY